MLATLQRLAHWLWDELFIGLPMPEVHPENANYDSLYVEYRMRCALARRGWRVSHLVPPEEYAQKPLAPTLLTHPDPIVPAIPG